MKLFQVNTNNYIAVDSVSGITLEHDFAVVFTTTGAKHRITLTQARQLLSCFELIKPIIDVTESVTKPGNILLPRPGQTF